MRRKRVISTKTCVMVTAASTAVVLAAVALAPSASSAAKDSTTVRQVADGTGVQHVITVTGVQMRRHPALPERYTVERGDTLSLIAGKTEGSAGCWPGIYRANSSQISNPNIIYAGESLEIPAGCDTRAVSYSAPVTHSAGDGAVASAPAPAPASYGLSGTLSYGQLEVLWESAGGPSWAAPNAASIAECESAGNQYAYNPSGASGYWQILGEVVAGDIFNPMVNAENAVAKFRASGDTFAQWVCQA